MVGRYLVMLLSVHLALLLDVRSEKTVSILVLIQKYVVKWVSIPVLHVWSNTNKNQEEHSQTLSISKDSYCNSMTMVSTKKQDTVQQRKP